VKVAASGQLEGSHTGGQV